MKKLCLTGVIIILIAIWIWYFLEINHSDNNEPTQWVTGYNEESFQQTILTWDEDNLQPELDVEQETWEIEEEIEEKIEEKNEENVKESEIKEPEIENNYPIYWVIENDYWDESAQWEEDENIQETEELLMGALNQRDEDMKKEEKVSNITVIIDWKNYTAELEDNETAQNFYQTIIANNKELLMENLNENEKYIYLQEKLPNSPKVPEKIESWDIMLYWNNCIVIFYKSFTTTYSYTKIGHIKNMQDLWTESVTVQFS